MRRNFKTNSDFVRKSFEVFLRNLLIVSGVANHSPFLIFTKPLIFLPKSQPYVLMVYLHTKSNTLGMFPHLLVPLIVLDHCGGHVGVQDILFSYQIQDIGMFTLLILIPIWL